MIKFTHSTTTEVLQNGRSTLGISRRRHDTPLQTRVQAATSGDVHLAHMAAQAARRGANARGSTTLPVGAQIRRGDGQGDAFRRCKDTAAHCLRNQTARTGFAHALTLPAKGVLCARTAHHCARRDYTPSTTATRGTSGPTPAAQKTRGRRLQLLRCYAKEGLLGAHLGDAGGDLDRSRRRGEDGAVDEEEDVPRRGSTARVRFGAANFNLQGGTG